jgi:hypothetical protein
MKAVKCYIIDKYIFISLYAGLHLDIFMILNLTLPFIVALNFIFRFQLAQLFLSLCLKLVLRFQFDD